MDADGPALGGGLDRPSWRLRRLRGRRRVVGLDRLGLLFEKCSRRRLETILRRGSSDVVPIPGSTHKARHRAMQALLLGTALGTPGTLLLPSEGATIVLNNCTLREVSGVVQSSCPISSLSGVEGPNGNGNERIAWLEAEVLRLRAAFDAVAQSVALPPSPPAPPFSPPSSPAPPSVPHPPSPPEPYLLTNQDGTPICGGWFPGHSPCDPYGFDGITARCSSCYATAPASSAGVMVAANMGTGAGPWGGYDWGDGTSRTD